MEESAEEAQKRDETIRIYNSTKEALRIIDDVARDSIKIATSASQTNAPAIQQLLSTTPPK